MVDRRLGRGLDFFLSGGRNNPPASPGAERPPAAAPDVDASKAVQMVETGRLEPNPFQPRRSMDESELEALANSIRASGILQPILTRRVGERLQIVAGERRWRAAQLAGLTEVPILVRPLSDQDSAIFALVENLQREDLNAIDKAAGIQQLMKQAGATQEVVAKQLGFDRSTVANLLRLLDLPQEVQAHVSRGTLSMGHARALLGLSEPDLMRQVADASIKEGLSVRQLEARVKELQQASTGQVAAAGKSKGRPVWLNELEESLVEALGTPVAIRYGRKRSQIVIDCAGREEFERLFQRLKNA